MNTDLFHVVRLVPCTRKEYGPISRFTVVALEPYESIDTEDGDLERNTVQLHTPYYPFHHGYDFYCRPLIKF